MMNKHQLGNIQQQQQNRNTPSNTRNGSSSYNIYQFYPNIILPATHKLLDFISKMKCYRYRFYLLSLNQKAHFIGKSHC